MSSTNKTANLGLPQWEASDAVEMADFNDCLAKIDMGIGRWKLLDHVVSEQTATVQLNLSAFSPEKFAELCFCFDLNDSGLYMRINGVTGECYHCTYYSGSSGQALDKMTLSPNIAHIFMGRNRYYVRPETTLQHYVLERREFPYIYYAELFRPDGVYFEAGERITVWGVAR